MSGARFTIGQRLLCVLAVTLRLVTGLAAAGVVLVQAGTPQRTFSNFIHGYTSLPVRIPA